MICVRDFPRGEVSVKVGVMEFGLEQTLPSAAGWRQTAYMRRRRHTSDLDWSTLSRRLHRCPGSRDAVDRPSVSSRRRTTSSSPSPPETYLQHSKHQPQSLYTQSQQEAQLSLEKADRTVYHVQSPAFDFQACRESNYSKVAQFHARYVNETLLSKSAINARMT